MTLHLTKNWLPTVANTAGRYKFIAVKGILNNVFQNKIIWKMYALLFTSTCPRGGGHHGFLIPMKKTFKGSFNDLSLTLKFVLNQLMNSF